MGKGTYNLASSPYGLSVCVCVHVCGVGVTDEHEHALAIVHQVRSCVLCFVFFFLFLATSNV